jgi:uncharacterized protein YbjT (DUF2867 family)
MTQRIDPPSGSRPTVVVAGASGYVGTALGAALSLRFETVGLSRRPKAPGAAGYHTWRAVDLVSLRATERALRGATFAVYLVHSMVPSDRLTQGGFEDFDLLCADNFARAAAAVGVKHIVYLGGLLPIEADTHHPADTPALSAHLASRLETERALAAHGVPVTTLRAGLVIGAGGSSFAIMERLVRRLPAMLCPAWTATLAQPISLSDTVALLDGCVGRADLGGQAFDIGGPDVLTYRQMMQATARALGLTRRMVGVPLLSPGLSRLWLSLVTGAPRELAAPLVESLVHPMIARSLDLQQKLGLPPTPFAQALQEALAAPPQGQPWRPQGPSSGRVRSIQRMTLPEGRDAAWAAAAYMRWLPKALWPLLEVTVEEGSGACAFRVRGIKAPLLTLRLLAARSTPTRQVLLVEGGLLVKPERGGDSARDPDAIAPLPRLEFRVVNGGEALLAAVHDFAPRLPWPVYVCTQALAHLLVMRLFGRYLKAQAAEAP